MPGEIDWGKIVGLINKSGDGGAFFDGLEEDDQVSEGAVKGLLTGVMAQNELKKHYEQGSLSTFRSSDGHKAVRGIGMVQREVDVDSSMLTPFSDILKDAKEIKYDRKISMGSKSVHRYIITTNSQKEVQYMLKTDQTRSSAARTDRHAIEFIYDGRSGKSKRPTSLRTAHPVFDIVG